MAKNNGPKYQIPTPASPKPSKLEKPVNLPVSISFKAIREGDKYCLSLCDKDEIRAYLQSLRLLTSTSWMSVIGTGGKPHGGKVGLGYTKYDSLKFEEVSEDIVISGLRAGAKLRFYGYHMNHIYYVVRFDPRHELVPAD